MSSYTNCGGSGEPIPTIVLPLHQEYWEYWEHGNDVNEFAKEYHITSRGASQKLNISQHGFVYYNLIWVANYNETASWQLPPIEAIKKN